MMLHPANLVYMRYINFLALTILFANLGCNQDSKDLSAPAEPVTDDAAEAVAEVASEPENPNPPAEKLPEFCLSISDDLLQGKFDNIHKYLVSQVDTIEPKEIMYYDYSLGENVPKTVCGFKQKFANGITYRQSSCKESGDLTFVSIPCADKSIFFEIIKAIHTEDGYAWNQDSTEYGPADGEAGCYYNISLENGYYVLNTYCGC